jgi:hypothetical protein
LLAAAVFSSCEKGWDNPVADKFDYSLIPGNYSGEIIYENLAHSNDSTGYITDVYKTTIIENGESFTFVFDPDFSIQIPNIEIFTSKTLYKFSGHQRVSITSIQSENYVKLIQHGRIDEDAWKFFNYFDQVFYMDGTRFNLLLQSEGLDSTYMLEISGQSY